MASGDAVQQIKDRLPIEEVVASYVELHKAGKNFKGKSPFTNEKTPSFYVSPDRGMYYCFSSSQGGDVFTFIQAMEGVDFKGALKILADKAGVELVPEDPKKKTERDRQYDVLEEATKFFEAKFANETVAKKYLEDRGVIAETRARWRIGYAPGPPQHGWRDLKSYLEGKGYTQSELVRAGLIKGLDTGKEPYDVFRDRVMFPISDSSGRVVAYSGRILAKDSDAPKYVNSPETELFVKSDILFGYDKAKEGIRKLNFSLIVEGQFDVVLAHQTGYNNTVAVSGTALTPHHVDLLQRLSNRVVLALDGDRAGIAAVKRAADLMLGRSMDVKVATMVDGKDPADMIQADPEKFKNTIKSSQHVIEYLLDVLEADKKDDRTWKLLVHEEVLPYVAKIPNAIDREYFEKVIAARLETTKEAIHVEVGKLLERSEQQRQTEVQSANPPPVPAQPIATADAHAERIFAALEFLRRFAEGDTFVTQVEAFLSQVLETQYSAFKNKMDEERLNPTIMDFERLYESYPDQAFFEHFSGRLHRFVENALNQQLTEIIGRMQTAGASDSEYDQLRQRAHEIAQKKAKLQEELGKLFS